ncbi:MAG: BA14K family protein [Xanthobacteraceae bacterium]
MKISKTALVAAMIGAMTISSVNPVSAAKGRNKAAALGAVGGFLLGSVIASQARPRYYYDSGPAYYYAPPPRVYYAPAPRVYYGPPAYAYDPAIAYCMRRFKSYDPYSMTYLGYDGYRHYCP